MNVNFYDVHFTVATVAYYKFKDIFAIIFSDQVIGDRICFFCDAPILLFLPE